MTPAGLVAIVIGLPLLHALLSFWLVGSGICLLLDARFPKRPEGQSPASRLLQCMAIGILANAAEFLVVLLLAGTFRLHAHGATAAVKYALDLGFVLWLLIRRRSAFLRLLRESLPVSPRRENLLLFILAVVLGILAILNFPHVLDSGQLIITNGFLQHHADFFSAKRYGVAFSAMAYFPAALLQGVPPCTLASGFKLSLLLLVALAAIRAVEKLGLSFRGARLAVFGAFIFSFFGLYGVMELGKDSIWAVLFSLLFMLSLVSTQKGAGCREPVIYALTAGALGMIAIPYMAGFIVLYAMARFLPRRLTRNGWLCSAAVLLLLAAGALLMPVRLAIKTPPHREARRGPYEFRKPTDGHEGFIDYFFRLKKRPDYANASPLLVAGALGALLLPLLRRRSDDPALQGMALFPFAAACCALLLAHFAQGFLPDSNQQVVPQLPISTFYIWNLVKDIPQWYLQPVLGLFALLLLDEALRRVRAGSRTVSFLHGTSLALLAAALLTANSGPIARLGQFAHFQTYGGHRDERFALLLENLHLNPGIRRVLSLPGSKALGPNLRAIESRHFHFRLKIDRFSATSPALAGLGAFRELALVGDRQGVRDAAVRLEKTGFPNMYELEYFPDLGEGIYLLSRQERRPPCTCLHKSGGR